MKHNTEVRENVVKVYLNDTEKSFLQSVYGAESKLGPLLRNAGKTIAAYQLHARNDRRRFQRSEGPFEGLGRPVMLPGRARFAGRTMSLRM